MENKQCCICKKIKPLSDYYVCSRRKDGHQTYCKLCDRAYKRKYVGTPKAKKRIKKYNQSKHGKEIINKAISAYRKRNKEKLKAAARTHYAKYPEKGHAKNMVNSEIRKGNILPATNFKCTYCDKQAKLYHHYLGYNPENILDVEPICFSCHTLLHNKLSQE